MTDRIKGQPGTPFEGLEFEVAEYDSAGCQKADPLLTALVSIRDRLAGHQHAECDRCHFCRIIRECDTAIAAAKNPPAQQDAQGCEGMCGV